MATTGMAATPQLAEGELEAKATATETAAQAAAAAVAVVVVGLFPCTFALPETGANVVYTAVTVTAATSHERS
jgi:hypothetical protein